MSKRKFRLPSPALVISMVALALVLGGTAVAATVGGHADAKADTTLVKKLAPTLSVKHATSADSGEPVAFAQVDKEGVIDTANSKNVTAVTVVGTSFYCLSGLVPGITVRGGQATVDYGDALYQTAQFGLGDHGGVCPAGTQAYVWTYDPGSGGDAAGFFVMLYG